MSTDTQHYVEHYEGYCDTCDRAVEGKLKLPMNENSPPGIYVRCRTSGDITWTEKQHG